MVTLLASLLPLLACAPEGKAPPSTASVDATSETSETPGDTPTDGTSATDGEGSTGTTGEAEPPPAMDPIRLLFRTSLDLRGVRPSLEEIEAVEADPAAIEGLIDGFLLDPRFGERVVSLYSEIYLTRLDSYYVKASDYDLGDEPVFAASVGQEPLRILAHIAENDLPYTDIVTADWTMADQTLADAWALDFLEGDSAEDSAADSWRQARYTDGRPSAGVLTTNSMWWRYMSTASNGNRGRANAVSRILLCSDFLQRPVEFDRDVNLLDEDAVNEALKTNAGCVSCHYALEPLASYFWGFYYFDYDSFLDTTDYHPERERLWEDYSAIAPGYFGEPGYSLTDLGRQLAGDARFPQCAVEQAYGLLLQRDVTLDDTDRLNDLRGAFLDAELRMRPLIRAVVDAPEYRAGPTDDERYAAWKLSGPDLLGSQLEDLTGFRFTSDGYDMLSTDTVGLRILAGGVDGRYVAAPARAPTATMVLVLERLAEAAAEYGVQRDRENPDEARLFTEVDFTETPDTDPEAVTAQVQRLHLLLFGERVAADGPEVEANLALWQELYAIDRSPASAWSGLLSALIRDPRFLFY